MATLKIGESVDIRLNEGFSTLACKLQTYTYCRIAQLPADHTSISIAPTIITDCSPHSIKAYLHSALSGQGSISQMNISLNKAVSSF